MGVVLGLETGGVCAMTGTYDAGDYGIRFQYEYIQGRKTVLEILGYIQEAQPVSIGELSLDYAVWDESDLQEQLDQDDQDERELRDRMFK